ncbi:MAG: hypothetical protein NVS4B11_00510 [Ktedonobacteraceae bacterium]
MVQARNEQRREAVRQQHILNGIDYLETSDDLKLPPDERQRILYVHFIRPLEPDALISKDVSIRGGERIRDVHITGIVIGTDERSTVLTVQVDKAGDYSIYTLTVRPSSNRLHLDPLLSAIDFTFTTEELQDIDCEQKSVQPVDTETTPEINYLAKDFNTFRQLMLDRMTTLIPLWQERSPADLGNVLVELLAYVGDYLSYQQDVIATESYITTARRRISMRRHARLIDYYMSEGCNARVWVQLCVTQDMVKKGSVPVLPKGTQLLTQTLDSIPALIQKEDTFTYTQALSAQPEVFETMEDVDALYKDHNLLYFYTWGAQEFSLPQGTIRATLRGYHPHLQEGDILIFQEIVGEGEVPDQSHLYSGSEYCISALASGNADPAHRHAVRLVKVEHTTDPLGKLFYPSAAEEPVSDLPVQGAPVVEPEDEDEIEDLEAEAEDDETQDDNEPPAPTPPVGMTNTHYTGETSTAAGESVRIQLPVAATDDDEPTEKLPIIKLAYKEDETYDKQDAAKEPSEDATSETEGSRKTVKLEASGYGETEGDATQKEEDKEPDYSLPITEIEWHSADALPFSFSLSKLAGGKAIQVSVALGNVVLADHGQTIVEEPLEPIVPNPTLFRVSVGGSGGDNQGVPPRFQPRLKHGPLTHAVPYKPQPGPYNEQNLPSPVRAAMNWGKVDALPALFLEQTDASGKPIEAGQPHWTPKRDLLSSDGNARNFVVEIETGGVAYLRFGDGRYGVRPKPGTQLSATYRVGNGTQGNIGANSLTHLVVTKEQSDILGNNSIKEITNPLPGIGGTEPESIENVRQHAPSTFNIQARGVTADDYVAVAIRDPRVHRAAAAMRWTGGWYTIFLALERSNNTPFTPHYKNVMSKYMERFRVAGYDIEIVAPVYVSLDIAIYIKVEDGYFRSEVEGMLYDAFNRTQPNGESGIFQRDSYTFGQPVYLSTLLAVVNAVPGIKEVQVTRFQRLGYDAQQTTKALREGVLVMDWREIARMDNDPQYPEHGMLHLTMEGGK